MKKKYLFLVCAILAALLLSTCDLPDSLKLPDSIEIESDEFKLSTRIKTGAFNLAEMLSTALKDSFPEGVTILDMVHENYKDTQTFLIGYEMELMPSFNPDDYLDEIEQQMDKMDAIGPGTIAPINPDPIELEMVPSHVEGETHWFDMSDLFLSMENQLNTTSTPKTTIDNIPLQPGATGDLPIPDKLQNLPPFMAITEEDEYINFESAIMVGPDAVDPANPPKIELTLSLESATDAPLDSEIDISIIGITLKGVTYYGSGNTPESQDARLHSGNGFNETIIVDLTDAEIKKDNPPQFTVNKITNNSAGLALPAMVKLIIQPKIRGIALRGATGLKIGTMTPDLPQGIVDKITLGEMPPEMLNAEVARGSIKIDADFPPGNDEDPTYCNGMFVEFDLTLNQAPVEFDGETFHGLAAVQVHRGTTDLDNSKISRESIEVTEKKMTIWTDTVDGASFQLYGEAYARKSLPIDITMGMEVKELRLVRWKRNSESGDDILPTPKVDPIDLGNIDGKDISQFIKTISFEEIVLGLDFTTPEGKPGLPEALQQRLALNVTCPDLGLDSVKMLNTGLNEFVGEETTMPLKDETGKAKILQVETEFFPVINGEINKDAKYMEFGPLEVDNTGKIQLSIYGKVDIDFNWTQAVIDLNQALEQANTDSSQLEGTYPQEGQEAIDLSEMGQYMNGFTLSDNIRARIFLSGPNKLINMLEPTLQLDALQGEEQETLIPAERLAMLEIGTLPVLAGTEETPYVYDGEDFPPDGGGIDIGTAGLTRILAQFPGDLRLSYKMGMPDEFPVKPDTFDDIDDQEGAITALVVLIMPLEFIGEPGAYISIPESVFGGDSTTTQELFGRTNTDEPVFGDVRIKSAGIRIDFDQAFFKNAVLYIQDPETEDPDKLLFPDGFNLNNGRNNSLSLNLDEKDWKIINNNLIHPNIRVVFPKETTVRIPRKTIPARITVAGSIGYTVDLEALGLGN